MGIVTPKGSKTHKKPIISEDFEYIITYEERTFSNWLKNVLKWGFDGTSRWYELEYFSIKDIYQFKNPNSGINCATDNRRRELQDLVFQYKEDFLVELEPHELLRLGLNSSKYQKIQRAN